MELELPEEHPYLAAGAPVYLASSSAVKGKYAYQKPKPGAYRNRAELAVRVEIGADEVRAVCCGADGCAGTAEHIADGSAGTAERIADGSAGTNAERFAGVAAVMRGISAGERYGKVEAAVREAFAKTGGTAFTVAALDIANSEARFVPVSVLNELRRGLLDKAAAAAKLAEEEAAVQMAESRQAVKTGGAEAVNECENIDPDAGGNCLATCATERQVKNCGCSVSGWKRLKRTGRRAIWRKHGLYCRRYAAIRGDWPRLCRVCMMQGRGSLLPRIIMLSRCSGSTKACKSGREALSMS